MLQIDDYADVVALWRRSEGVGLNASDTRRGIAAYLRRNPRLSFVAEKKGRIVGAVLCGHDGRRGYLHHLAVARQCRGKGIGRQLVAACLAGLRRLRIQRGNIFVFADNREGRRFWERNGWKLRSGLRMMQIKVSAKQTTSARRSC